MTRRTENDPERVRKLLLSLDGLRYSFGICEMSYARAMQVLRGFEKMLSTGAPTHLAIQAVADMWSAVDGAHRIRLLLNQMPFVPKKDPSIRLFLDATSAAENMRHYMQHMNGEITTIFPLAPSVWGAISWVGADDPRSCFTLMTGSTHLAQSLTGLAFDIHKGEFTTRW
jgi:hypothetical protein